jgi:HTH-type transcriptional regulator/antitoxin HigA
MSHLFDPEALHDDVEYAAAIDELEQLLLADPDTPAGRRFDELIALIEEFDARRGGYELWQAKRVAA